MKNLAKVYSLTKKDIELLKQIDQDEKNDRWTIQNRKATKVRLKKLDKEGFIKDIGMVYRLTQAGIEAVQFLENR